MNLIHNNKINRKYYSKTHKLGEPIESLVHSVTPPTTITSLGSQKRKIKTIPNLSPPMDNENLPSIIAGKPIRCRGTVTYIVLYFYSINIANHPFRFKHGLNYEMRIFSYSSWKIAAAICRAPGEPLVIEEITVDPPKSHEVRVRIICTSLCYSDVTFWKMKVSCRSLNIVFNTSFLFYFIYICFIYYACFYCLQGFSCCFSKNSRARGYRVRKMFCCFWI